MTGGAENMTRRFFLKAAGAGAALALAADAALADQPPTKPTHPGSTTRVERRYEDIKAEFDEYGWVVLPDAIPRRDAARLEERLKEILGRRPDAGKADQHLSGVFNYLEPKDDPLFLPLVTQPTCLRLARDLLGEGFQMTEVGCRWRKPGALEGPIHATRPLDVMDRNGLPAPNQCLVLAFSWMLNDLTRDMGATLYLPFSQYAPRGPRAGVRYQHLVPVEASAGSVLIHHSGLWHHFGANTTKDKARMGLMGGYFPFWMDPVAVGWQPMKRSVRDRLPEAVRQMNKHVTVG
jgi:hypothetical protein